MRYTTTILIGILIGVGALASGAAADTLTWSLVGNGNWSGSANWNPPGVPDAAGESAVIGVAGTYIVTMDMAPTIDWLTISNPDATLRMNSDALTLLDSAGLSNSGRIEAYSGGPTLDGVIANAAGGELAVRGGVTLTLKGDTLTNDGLITVNYTSSGSSTILQCDADMRLAGVGELVLNRTGVYSQLCTTTGHTLTNDVGHTISGRGQIPATLLNRGLVDANVDGQVLQLLGADKVNEAMLAATNGGLLDIESLTVTQTGGELRADGGTVRLKNATIEGGTLATTGESMIQDAAGTSTLREVTVAPGATVAALAGTTLAVDGETLTNDGAIRINPLAAGSAVSLHFVTPVALTGAGAVQLENYGEYARVTAAEGVVFTQAAGHAIRGRGRIYAGFVNEGTVCADNATHALELRTEDKVNNGLYEAIDGATLSIDGPTIDQTGGGVITAAGGAVRYQNNSSVIGGTLSASGDGVHTLYSTTTTLHDVTIAAGTPVGIRGGATMRVTGSTLTNDGTITVNSTQSGAATILLFAEPAVLTGGGVVLLNYYNGYTRLQTDAGVVFTNSVDQLIHGRGYVEADLVNDGIIRADHSDHALTLLANSKTNNGVFEAVDGAEMAIDGIAVTQSPAGEIRADGGTVRLTNVPVTGGLLTTMNDGALVVAAGTTTLTDVTVAAGTRINTRGNSIVLIPAGETLTNNGTICINEPQSGSATLLTLEDGAALAGSGEVLMDYYGSYAQITAPTGATCTNGAQHAIRGRGQIHAGLVNEGLIEATSATHALCLVEADKTNHGTLAAASGAELDIDAIAVQNAGGLIQADGGTVNFRNGVTVIGGTLASSGAGKVVGYNATTLSDITLAGGTYAVAGSTAHVTTLDGTLVHNGGTMACGNRGQLNVKCDVQGSGGWNADGGLITFAPSLDILTDGPIRITGGFSEFNIGAGTYLTGSSLVMTSTGDIDNEGTIELSADLDFAMTSEASWDWDPAAVLVLTGTSDLDGCSNLFWSTVEVGDRDNGDSGPDASSYSIPSLTVVDGAIVALVDYRNNGNRSGPEGDAEALYLGAFALGDGATLNLNGLHAYVYNGVDYTLLEAGVYDGGVIVDEHIVRAGDVDGSGVVDYGDIDPFVAALTGGGGPDAVCAADANGDGVVNYDDIDPFVALIGG